jgi:hypothetical protein
MDPAVAGSTTAVGGGGSGASLLSFLLQPVVIRTRTAVVMKKADAILKFPHSLSFNTPV